MSDTEQKARAGMGRFVLAISVLAILIAGGYFVFLTPGETNPPPPEAIDLSD